MLPIMLTEGGKPFLAAGASGGRRIMAAVFQLMTFIADFGMGVDDAAHHPRIDVSSVDAVSADRRLPAACWMRWRPRARWRWSSTARCRSTSPARM